MGNRNSYVGVTPESVYGTFPTPTWRSYEAEADPLTGDAQRLILRRQGLRQGRQGMRRSEAQTIPRGAEGTLPLTVMQRDMGVILNQCADTTTGPTLQTTAYLAEFDSAVDPDEKSFSLQTVRGTIASVADAQAYTHLGCVVTGWELDQQAEEYLRLNVDIDAQSVTKVPAAHTADYGADEGVPYHWAHLAVTLDIGGGGAAQVCPRSLSIRVNRGFATSRYRLCNANGFKSRPRRTEDPTAEITFDLDYADEDVYDALQAGTEVAFVALWTGANIDVGEDAYVQFTAASCRVEEGDPQVEVEGGDPTQPVKLAVEFDDTNNLYELDTQSADSAL